MRTAPVVASTAPTTSLAKTTVANPMVFAIRPLSGPASGATSASVYGLGFAAGSTISIGGVPATAVSFADATRLNAKTPALTPGSVNDVVVTVPGSSPRILPGAWFARFLDVPTSYLFDRAIEKLRRMGITTGCGGGNYCPNDAVTRAQMAVFILRGKHGSGYHPPHATGTVFDDVPKTALFADWMEEFAAEGITTGCGGKNYCPNNSVTRGEMAVFLLRARLGSSHNPPPATGAFTDVTTTTTFAKWIEELAGRGITSGCGGGAYCATQPSTRGQMAAFLTKTFGTSPSELIADDLAHGDIDYETSLLYRFYALVSDQRLPAKYRNAPSDGEDSGLFAEVEAVLPGLSPAGQAALAPYLSRPDDPASPFGPAASPLMIRRPDDGSQNHCQTDFLETSGSHFKIHVCSTGDDAADASLLSSVLGIAEPLWDPMTAGMGTPIADCYTPQGGNQICPGGDGKIDVYLLATNQCWESPPPGNRCWSIEEAASNAVAVAVPAQPMVNKTSSGFILLSRDRAADPDSIRTDFAHEFFHVLQFRHNQAAMSASTGVVVNGRTLWWRSWFVEASATWAEWQYVPATSPEEVHWRFTADFQPSRASLSSDSPAAHMYGSYIWPFFLEQEKGKSSVFQAWVAAEGAADPEGITAAVDQQLPFEDHFRDFAVRNWNTDLPGHPIPALYKDLQASDGSSPPFPAATPPLATSFELPLTSTKVTTVNVSLAAEYDEITFQPEVRKVILKFDQLPASVDVDLLVEIDGSSWNLERVDKDAPVVYCRDHVDENVSRIIVITSNHDKTRFTFAAGDYEVEGRPGCCSELAGVTAWKGRVTASYGFGGTQVEGDTTRDYTISQSFEISGDLTKQVPGVFKATFFTGSASENDEVQSHIPGQDLFPNTQVGTGGLAHDTGLGLAIDLQTCTFTFGARATTEVVNNFQPLPQTPFVDLVGIARGLGTHSLTAFTDKLSGTASFPAHSVDWDLTHFDGDGYIVGGLGAGWFLVAGGEDSAGSAQITWEFTPDPPVASQSAPPPNRPK